MIASNRSPELQNALVRRIQRYARSSAIFRPTASGGDTTSNIVQRAAKAPTKAALLPAPSSLPVGRTVDAQSSGSMPIMPDSYSAELPVAPAPAADSISAAIEHVTQMQRSPDPQAPANMQTALPQMPPLAPAVVDTPPTVPSVIQRTSDSASTINDRDWSDLQRIKQIREAKRTSESAGQSAAPTPPDVQRAVDAAESTSTPSQPKKAPLESIWPVEQAEPEVTNDEPVVMRQPDAPISTEPIQPPAEANTIRNKLEDVASTRQTDSSIELHLPRRPRPAPIQTKPKPTKEEENKAFWDQLRGTEENTPETVQRTVETEIGPLPADMWEMLGETPPDTPQTGGESAPTVQTKPAEVDTTATSQETNTEETTSFLAEAAPTAPTPPDAIQRAIAAAEAPKTSTKAGETSTKPTIQRKETITPASTSTSAPTSESSIPSQPVAPSIQRTVEDPTESIAKPAPHLGEQASNVDTPANVQRAIDIAETSPPAADQPVTDAPTTVQRAIEAAETSPLPTDQPVTDAPTTVQRAIETAETSPPATDQPITDAPTTVQRAIEAAETSPSTITQPITDSPTSVQRAIEAAEAPPTSIKSTPPASPKTTTPIVLPEPKSQRMPADPADEPSPAGHTTVDLNAETAPLPTLPEMPEAVFPPAQSSADAIQRAIAAAEAPSAAAKAASPKVSDMQTKETAGSGLTASADTSSIQRAAAPETKAPTAQSTLETPTTETAVPPSTTASSEAIQRAVTAAEAPASKPTANIETTAPMADTTTPSLSTTTSPEAIQRAVAAAEAPPSKAATSRETTTPTAVTTAPTAATTPPITQSTPTQLQRQPARETISPSTPTSPPEMRSVPTATPFSYKAQIQRAIAAAEAPPAETAMLTIQPTPAASQTAVATSTPLNYAAQIQRAIAAAEAPPAETAMPTIQPTPAASQTAVATPTATTPAIMRAIAAAEKPAAKKSTSEAYEWPDIKSALTADNIQRAESETVDTVPQAQEPAPTANTDENETVNRPPSIDVNRLADQVYSQLKKRLTTEWERGRGIR